MTKRLTDQQRKVVAIVAAVVILLGVWSLLSQTGVLTRRDSLAGGFAIGMNPAPDATQEQRMQDIVFGFERLVLNRDHTFYLGFLKGDWSRSGDTLSLTPTSAPPADQFYAKTSMATALSALLKPSTFKITENEKKLTLENPTNGPVVLTKAIEFSKDL